MGKRYGGAVTDNRGEQMLPGAGIGYRETGEMEFPGIA